MSSPLSEAALRAIDECLSAGELDEGSRRLSELGQDAAFAHGSSYLATRLLYLRGRLDAESVRERLVDLLSRAAPFPEAAALLVEVEHALRPSQNATKIARVVMPSAAHPPATHPPATHPPEAETAPAASRRAVVALGLSETQELETPRAPSNPQLGPREPAWHHPTSVLPPPHRASTRPRQAPASIPPEAGRYSYVSERVERVSLPPPASTFGSLPAFDAERRLARGEREPAIQIFEREAWQAIAQLADPREVVQLSQAGARVLSACPVSRWFGPFDSSLYSLDRLALALDVLWGNEPVSTSHAGLTVLAAYLGETIRRCLRGQWLSSADPLEAREVQCGAFTWHPHALVQRRQEAGGEQPLADAIAPGLPSEGSAAWLSWAPAPDPGPAFGLTAEPFVRLAASLSDSPWSRLCLRWGGTRLDASWNSLTALETLSQRVLRSAAPLDGNEPWLLRCSVLLGAYVGEVVRRQVGGHWRAGSAGGHELLLLPSGFEADPVAALRERIKAQNGVRLVSYATALLRK